MCTVSFYSDENKVILTSNRDENSKRPAALAPEKYVVKDSTLYYPKDPQAGGTWFVVKSNGDALVLLNGSEKKHDSTPPYRKSRGLILLDIACKKNMLDYWKSINLNYIEPYTLVVFEYQKLYQLRWDGTTKKSIELSNEKPHIWSSSTLYSTETTKNREDWFSDFLKSRNHKINENDLFQFHSETHTEDSKNGLIINRNDKTLTKSITQCVLSNAEFSMSHHDLATNTHSTLSANLEP